MDLTCLGLTSDGSSSVRLARGKDRGVIAS